MATITRYLPARFKRSVIAPRFLERLNKSHAVVGGPFKGMRYHGKTVCGAAAPKLLGVYESELAPWFQKWSAIPFQHIINVGAAEGYYAVGCAMLWPYATVTAFESSEEGQRLLTRNVEMNELQSRVKIMGHCSQEQLRTEMLNGQPSLVIIDVEGAEGHLLKPTNIRALADAYIIVEIHDFVDERVGQTVWSQLQSSHVIEEVRTERRTFWDFHEPRALWLRLWLLPYLKQYANELRPGSMRWFCCTPINARRVQSMIMTSHAHVTVCAQRKALRRKFAPGLLRPFSGMNVSVRLGEIAQTLLSRWSIPPKTAKPTSTLNFCYLTVSDRAHWLMLRESLFSLYRSWNSLPKITVVLDGSWKTDEFAEIFAWWPAPISVLTREEVSSAVSSAGFPDLADYAQESPYGLKLAAIVTQARKQPVLFVDADILWFRDPAPLLGDPALWQKPRALRESNCHQRRDIAIKYCVQVLEPPFVNSGIVALHGELMTPALLRSMVRDALRDPKDSSCEQTIIATAVKLGGEFFPEKLSFVEFDDVHRFRSRSMKTESCYSRHYVNWMRHLLYRDALKLRLHRGTLETAAESGRIPNLHRNGGAHLKSEEKLRVLLVSIVPPRNDCGVRIVMHRMFVERSPFELHVASNADFANDLLVHTPLPLPRPLHRLRKSRFGPRLAAWITDYENFVWPLTTNTALETAVETFKPDVILTLAECGLCHGARKTAQRHGLPLAGLFLDWFPVMKGHFGHKFTQSALSRRYRELYSACDLALCTSDGMQEVLGPHPNSHVIYPMPGRHSLPEKPWPPSTGKFRLVYVGSVQNFYGRMLCALIEKMETMKDFEITVVGPDADWPVELLERAKGNGVYLGFKSPEQAADVMASADALLVVMSFEKEHELFMRTSFTTKFLDYVAFGKPVILCGPEYCTPVRVARKHGGAIVVNQDDADAIVSACRQIAHDAAWREQLSQQARQLHQTLFNPDRQQKIFVREIEKLVRSGGPRN